jgi:hypothetical protein
MQPAQKQASESSDARIKLQYEWPIQIYIKNKRLRNAMVWQLPDLLLMVVCRRQSVISDASVPCQVLEGTFKFDNFIFTWWCGVAIRVLHLWLTPPATAAPTVIVAFSPSSAALT